MNKSMIKNLVNRRTVGAVLFIVFVTVLFICAFGKEKVHIYKSVVTTQGDCVTPGVRTFKCIRCSYKHTEPITGGHKNTDILVIAPDESMSIVKRCTVCGNESSESIKKPEDENKYSLISAEVSGVEKTYQSTGEKITPVPVVYDRDGKELTDGTDYTVKYSNNLTAGTAAVRIYGAGNYSNAIEVQFTISDMYWEEINGEKYYFKDDQVANGLIDIEGAEYYFNEEGIMQTGWQKIKGKYYCFDRINGEMYKDTVVDGITVDKKGAAEKSEYNEYKIETMMKAHQIVTEQTTASDTMEEKRLKIFNWEINHTSYRWRLLSTVYESDDWEMTFANDIFDEEMGCDVSDACAVAFLFREIGYTDIYVCHDTSHCWVSCGGKLFDPYYAETIYFDNNYDVKFTDARANPVERRRIDGVGADSSKTDESDKTEADKSEKQEKADVQDN